MTIETLAKAMNVDKQVVYGFFRFLKAIEAVNTSTEKVSGQRGKPTTQYTLSPDCVEKLKACLDKVQSTTV